jgi:hypothetical protein
MNMAGIKRKLTVPVTWLVGIAVKILLNYGVPLLEKKFPKIAPLLQEILSVLGGEMPSVHLHRASVRYEESHRPEYNS